MPFMDQMLDMLAGKGLCFFLDDLLGYLWMIFRSWGIHSTNVLSI